MTKRIPSKLTIAIDGPAGAGKSTIARRVAEKLRFSYVDTGAMYRAVALKALRLGVSFQSPQQLTRVARSAHLGLRRVGGKTHIFLDGKNVSSLIRTEEVSKATNLLATVKGVRKILQKKQKALGKRGQVVMEGRDIGTVVLPKAPLKIFLDASPTERARRRFLESRKKGKSLGLKSIAAAIRRRDQRDRNRKNSPLRAAKDAIHLDTTGLTVGQVVKKITSMAQNKIKGPF